MEPFSTSSSICDPRARRFSSTSRSSSTADNHRAIYIPERFAHGYQALEDETETSYQVGEFYTPGAEGGLRYDDPALGLTWPLPVSEISEKDAAWPLLAEVESEVRRRMAVDADREPAGAV